MDPAAYEVVHELEESHWFFVARRRILSRLLDDMMDGEETSLILDVGCGTGATMGFLEHYGEVTGVDISPRAVQYCREQGRSRLCMADGGSLPFADKSFDLVTALDLLEHLEQESAGLREMRRVLKDDGQVVLVVPAFMFLWSEFDRFSGHFRRYGRADFKRTVEEAGFEVLRLSYFNTILFPFIWGVRVAKNFLGKWTTVSSDLDLPGGGLNGLLEWVFSLESGLIARGSLPFGVSLLCVATKGSPSWESDEPE
jgi:SAM-dependent methyltransferase